MRSTAGRSLTGDRREDVAGLAVLAVAFALDRLCRCGDRSPPASASGHSPSSSWRRAGVRAPAPDALRAVLAWATAGELFCSLLWGLYTNRLGNIPHFVPPGHVVVFLIGLQLRPATPAAADRLTAAYEC